MPEEPFVDLVQFQQPVPLKAGTAGEQLLHILDHFFHHLVALVGGFTFRQTGDEGAEAVGIRIRRGGGQGGHSGTPHGGHAIV